MPRNPAGTYTFPALGNPAVTNTPITIAWWNGTYVDVATALTNSFDRTGATGGMTGQFKSVDGSAGAPGLTFGSDSTTGFSITTPGELDVSISGALVSRWTSAGFAGTFDAGATWKLPIYNNHGDQTFTGGLDFSVGKLSIAGKAVQSKLTKATTSTGTFSTTSTSFTAVTNATVTFTATGGTVFVQLIPDDTTTAANITSAPSSGTTNPGPVSGSVLALSTDGGSTFFGYQTMSGAAVFFGFAYIPASWPVGGISTWFAPSAGSVTVALYAKTSSGLFVAVNNAKLAVVQF